MREGRESGLEKWRCGTDLLGFAHAAIGLQAFDLVLAHRPMLPAGLRDKSPSGSLGVFPDLSGRRERFSHKGVCHVASPSFGHHNRAGPHRQRQLDVSPLTFDGQQ
jgi:hypothetical protein